MRGTEITNPSPAIMVGKLTGPDSLPTSNGEDTGTRWGVDATDLGIAWDNGAGEYLFAFGDTWDHWRGNGIGGTDHRNNVLLRGPATVTDDGLSFTSAAVDASGKARQVVPKSKACRRSPIPTGGIEVGGRQFLAYMAARHPPKLVRFCRIAYSDDNGENWRFDGPRWRNTWRADHPFQQLAFERHADYVYAFGTGQGRHSAASVARVRADPDAILERRRYEYWHGPERGWVGGRRADVRAVPIVEAPVGEPSVRYHSYSRSWLMTHLRSVEGKRVEIVLRRADEPQGPWGEPQVLLHQADFWPQLYGGFLLPDHGGPEVYFTVSEYRKYNVYLMRVSLTPDGTITNPNLVRDPSFERVVRDGDGDLRLNPVWQGGALPQRGDANPDGVTYRGSYGAITHAKLRGGPGAGIYQDIEVEPGTGYALRGLLRTPGREVTGTLGVRTTEGQDIAVTSVEADAWTPHRVRFHIGNHTTVRVFAEISAGSDTAPLELDDLAVYQELDDLAVYQAGA